MDPSNEEWAVTQLPWFFHHRPQTQISSFLWNKHHNYDMPNKYHFENILRIHSINCTSKPVSKCWTNFLKECTQNVCIKIYIPLKKTFNWKYAKLCSIIQWKWNIKHSSKGSIYGIWADLWGISLNRAVEITPSLWHICANRSIRV